MNAMAASRSLKSADSARIGSARRPAHSAWGVSKRRSRLTSDRGMVHAAETREAARDALVERWDRERIAAPDRARIIRTHTNDEARELNQAARERMREVGALGEDAQVTTERGARSFAPGDRVMFLKNERGARG